MRWAAPVVALLVMSMADAQNIEWAVVDVVQQREFTAADAFSKLTAGGSSEVQPAGSDLAIAVRYEPMGEGTRIRVHLADRSGRDRGLVLRLTVPLSADAGWRWWQDPDSSMPLREQPLSNTTGLRELPGLPEFKGGERPDYGRYSVYPLGAVQAGGRWLAIARLLGDLVLARFAAVGGPEPRLTAEVDLALSEFTRPAREADVELWFIAGDGAADDGGMRAALARYYGLAPQDVEVRAPQFGGWMPFTDLANLPNVDEFGFAYQEGAPNAAFDDALGCLSLVYFHCAGEFANVPDYQRGTQPLPPYPEVMEAFNDVAERHTGVKDVWDVCGIQGPDGKINYRPEGVYGDFFCQACVDPDLPYGKAMADGLLRRVTQNPFPTGIDGCYYDGIAAGLDYAPEHLRAANHLLLWDGKLGRPVNYNLWSSVEWARSIHDALAGTGKLTMLNDSSLGSFAFAAPYIDVPGAEMSILLSREQARLIRALTYHRPFCTLVKADFTQHDSAQIESYMRRCVAYGILPGFFDITPSGAHPGSSYWLHPEWYDRDRPLFRRYMPIARELGAAGWEPMPQARFEGDGACVERFGPAGGTALTYLAVSTDPGHDATAKRPIVLSLAPELAGERGDRLAVELLTGRIAKTADQLAMQMTGEDLAVWAIGDGTAQAQACLARARDVLDCQERYVAACRAGEAALAPWQGYGDLGAKIVSPGHESRDCLQAEKTKPGESAGANQTIVVNHDRPRTLIVSAWSKADGVTGARDGDYSLYVDCYYTDGSAIYGQTVDFATGTHDWEHGERVVEPAKPIRNINVYLLFRGAHTGRVWFDDIRVALQEEPNANLLPRGGFEPGRENRPLAGESPQAEQIRDAVARLGKLVSGEPGTMDWERAEELLASVEAAARQADWGPDTERTLRDAADARWHLKLAQACLRRAEQGEQRPTRLTELAPLQASAQATGSRQYRAMTGKMPQGTTVIVDSNYAGYGAEPLTDGKTNPRGTDWAQRAWASDENAGPHWIELRLPQATPVRAVRVWWAEDAGELHASRQVEAQAREGGEWRAVTGQEVQPDAEPGVTVIHLPPKAVKELRIHQAPHGGSASRPDLMWVTEVELVPD